MLITGELARLQQEIEEIARSYGLTFPEVRYEMVDYKTVNLLAAYDGFPIRYPHWRFGMEYERLSKSYAYGLHRIYEMVINTEPIYAYLLQSNLMVDQKLVMAHVCGHADFFANNLWFAHTNRKMLDEVANHAARIRNYMDRYGQETVESFLDACLSLDNLIDIHAPGVQRRAVVDEDETPQTVKK
ncbi:MAG TPA: SpoVR family protein, partial [Chloroflexota bacterium]|nr:SpoVR family protein [Chloroflexota bacterium]